MEYGTDAPAEQDYTVNVRNAVFIPELDAVREFVAELKAEFEANHDVATQFQDDPKRFLGDRGMNSDLQMEWMVELGVPGAEGGCFILSCIVTDGCLITDLDLESLLPF